MAYFNGNMPVFVQHEGDAASFRMITAQFRVNDNVKQMDIVRVLAVTKISLMRTVKRWCVCVRRVWIPFSENYRGVQLLRDVLANLRSPPRAGSP